MEEPHASVTQVTKAILMKDAVVNAKLTAIVRRNCPANVENVWTLVLELAELVPYVRFITMFQLVLVQRDILEIRSIAAVQYQ